MPKLIRASLTDQIFDYMRQKIASGEWKAGEKIPSENELAETLGVSRMSLRAAIQRANAFGFTETRVGSGTYVVDFSMKDLFKNLYEFKLLQTDRAQINEFRMIIQIGSVRLAFEHNNDLSQDIATLESIYQTMCRCSAEKDYTAFYDADYKFHECVCNLSHNQYISLLYEAIASTWFDVAKTNTDRSITEHKNDKLVLEFHRRILEGIKERNINKCIQAELESNRRSYSYYSAPSEPSKS
jgi:GntR family transcriptional repressor for pyruvate dehydrogenase complex